MVASAMPERFAVPVARLKGQRLTIVDFRSEVPRVVVDGKEVPAEPGISLVPGDSFAPGFINVTGGSVSTDIYENYLEVGDNGKPLDTRYKATLTADRDLQKVFLLFLLFEDTDGDFSEVPRLTMTDFAVGKLKGGSAKSVDFRFAPLLKRNSAKRMVWTVLAFSAGAQIKTSYGNGVLNAFFDSLDRVQRQKMIAQRSTGTFPLGLVRRFPITFSDELKQRFVGRTLNISADISADGELDGVDAEDPEGNEVALAAEAQLRYWLFLPRVVDGRPRPSTVVLPIKF